jgi:hypothetical protein
MTGYQKSENTIKINYACCSLNIICLMLPVLFFHRPMKKRPY